MTPATLARRTVGEWTLRSARAYAEPFADVAVEATFTAPSGRTVAIPAFHDGADEQGQLWRIRFNPDEAGRWTYRTTAIPRDDGLATAGSVAVAPDDSARGFLRATPGENWGLTYESGEPCFVFGDTIYNLFGLAHCGLDAEGLQLHPRPHPRQPLPPARRLQPLADGAHLGLGRQRTGPALRPLQPRLLPHGRSRRRACRGTRHRPRTDHGSLGLRVPLQQPPDISARVGRTLAALPDRPLRRLQLRRLLDINE